MFRLQVTKDAISIKFQNGMDEDCFIAFLLSYCRLTTLLSFKELLDHTSICLTLQKFGNMSQKYDIFFMFPRVSRPSNSELLW